MKVIIRKEQLKAILPPEINTIGDEAMFTKALHKYWPYNRVSELLKNQELVFVNPGLWKDPFERMYLDTDYTEFSFIRPKIYCMCLTTTLQNEEAAWKVYSSNDERTIRAKIDAVTLFEILSDYGKKKNFSVYFGNANYKLSKAEIINLQSVDSEFYPKFFEPFSLEKYLEIMTLKRRAFKYENELRIFIVPNKGNNYSEEILKIPIPADKFLSLITSFTIQPLDQLPIDDKLSKTKNAIMVREIRALYEGAKVYLSGLYDKCNPVKKVHKRK